MLGHHHLASPGAPSIPENFITGLLREGLPPAVLIVTEELTSFKLHDDRATKHGEIGNGAHVLAMDAMAYPSTVRTLAIRKTASRENTVV